MKKLADILTNIKVLKITGRPDQEIHSVDFDSRKVSRGSLFVAVKGTQVDGHRFIPQAIEKGAKTIVTEKLTTSVPEEITFIQTDNSAGVLGEIASAFYDHPSQALELIGITGTNGKTTVATLLYKLFMDLGFSSGLISTIENRVDKRIVKATHTTPDPVTINRLLKEMRDEGCRYCFMEVSSHAIDQQRISGLQFKGGIFTNITHDHLDYHETFNKYLKAKKQFFDNLPEDAFATTNADDKNGKIVLQNTKARVKTYGLKKQADFKGKIIENQVGGLLLNIEGKEAWFRLIGVFNAYNLLAAYATANMLYRDKEEILKHLTTLTGAEGRFEIIKGRDGITAIVDYAHTPDALKNALQTIIKLRRSNQQVITILGAGGDRDKTKRPLMGNIASSYSNKIILTSDNPRTEDPAVIIDQMMEGIEMKNRENVLRIIDRKQAIKTACMIATTGNIILVAGKGHEKYQVINGKKLHFDDKEIVNEYLKPDKNN